MKKLTAGIFATLLTVVTVGAANANIASQGYVDDIRTALEADIDAKADSATTLAGYGITDAYTKTEVDTAVNLKENSANKADTTTATTELNKGSETLFPTVAATYKIAQDEAATAVAGVTADVQGKEDKTNKATAATVDANTGSDTMYTSVAAAEKLVNDAVTPIETNVTDLQGRMTTAEGQITTLDTEKEDVANKSTALTVAADTGSETKYTSVAAAEAIADAAVAGVTADVQGKVDIDQGVEDANKAVITDGTGQVTVGQVSSGMIADGAIIEAKIGTGAVTTGKIGADAVTNAQLADNAVQTENIADGAVTEAKLDATLVNKMNSLIANPGACGDPANKCVLTYSGTEFAWEVIARGTTENKQP